MTTTELSLWTRIENFQLDNQDDLFKFSDRVARENGWTKPYTQRVIQEYRRFIFLCCISEQGITPSDPVDQVWHLHLTYTKSYWIDFCKNTLEREIHHNPTKGGTKEATKFEDYYTRLRELYTGKFGVAPPSDIWHPNEIRFSDIDFQRINLRRYWLVKKPSLVTRKRLVILSIILTGAISVQAANTFWFLVMVIIIAFLGVIWIVYNDFSTRRKKIRKNDSGCSVAGCSIGDGHHSHHQGSGCGSGCSGCSSSGCSGCGGGD